METLAATPSGNDTAVCGGVYLHSARDPLREAERLLESEAIQDGAVLLILGACLDYIERAARLSRTGIRVAAVYYSDFFHARGGTPPDAAWHPGKRQSIEDFLAAVVHEWDFSLLKIVDWEPAARAYPQVAQAVREAVRQHTREINGSLLTTHAFGRRWIKNSIKNFLACERYLRPRGGPSAVCICASGPSLQAFLPAARRFRTRFRLWALPSALPALAEAELEPDLAVVTDAGFYSRAHIEVWRGMSGRAAACMPLAMPFSAAGGPWLRETPVVPLVQDLFHEAELAGRLPFAPTGLAAHGTVAGTALRLALGLGAGAVVFAGLDLAATGGLDHIRPSPFEKWFDTRTFRTRPMETASADRLWTLYPINAGGLRSSSALETYAGWFRRSAPGLRGRVFRFQPAGAELGLSSVDSSFFENMPETHGPLFDELTPPGRPARKGMVRSMIEAWRALLRGLGGADLAAAGAPSRAFQLFYLLETRSACSLVRARSAGRAFEDELAEAAAGALGFLDALEAYAG